MKRHFQSLVSLTVASVKMYFRNISAVFFTLFIPVVLVLIFGFLNSNGGGPTLSVGLTNHANSDLATQTVKAIKDVKAFKVEEADESTIRDKLGKGKTDLQVVVPADYGQVANGQLKPAKLEAYYNEARPQTGQTAGLILGEIISHFNAGITKTPQLISVDTTGVKTNNLNAIDFLLPGIIAMSIMQLGIFSVAFAFISFKTTGALRRLQVAPIHPVQFIIAQAITRLIIGVAQVLLLVLLGLVVFHMHLIGSLLLMLGVAILGTLVFLAFGFMIAGAAHDENQAAPLSNIIAFPQLFLAGIFFPRDGFPHLLKLITDYLPLTFLGDAMRRIANEGVGIVAIKGDILGLLVWGIIAFAIAVRVFSWE